MDAGSIDGKCAPHPMATATFGLALPFLCMASSSKPDEDAGLWQPYFDAIDLALKHMADARARFCEARKFKAFEREPDVGLAFDNAAKALRTMAEDFATRAQAAELEHLASLDKLASVEPLHDTIAQVNAEPITKKRARHLFSHQCCASTASEYCKALRLEGTRYDEGFMATCMIGCGVIVVAGACVPRSTMRVWTRDSRQQGCKQILGLQPASTRS